MNRSILLFTALSGLSAGAHAQTAPAQPHFRRLFVSPMGEPFRGNGDQDQMVAWFNGVDRNGDGDVTRAEFVVDALRFFKLLDQDHDGAITAPEIDHYEADIFPEMSGLREPGGEQGRKAGNKHRNEGFEGAALYGILDITEPVTATDTDFDGRVSPQEFRAAASLRFDLLDIDKNGILTLAELPKLDPSGRQPRKQRMAPPSEPSPEGGDGN